MIVFSPEGLINEYVEDALVLRGGRIAAVPSLEDVETIRFPAPFGVMEAFNTSGGSSTLAATLRGRVRNLDYKTIRYPGHAAIVRGMKQLGLFGRDAVALPGGRRVIPREVAGALFDRNLPLRGEDAVLVRVTVEGKRRGRKARVAITLVDRMDRHAGLTAMMRCTAFPAACIAHMIVEGKIEARGVLRQEDAVPLDLFVAAMRRAGLEIKSRMGPRTRAGTGRRPR